VVDLCNNSPIESSKVIFEDRGQRGQRGQRGTYKYNVFDDNSK